MIELLKVEEKKKQGGIGVSKSAKSLAEKVNKIMNFYYTSGYAPKGL